MIVPDQFQFDGLGINIPFSAQTAGGALATQSVVATTDWSKVITNVTDSINKAIDTGASAHTSIIRAKAPVLPPPPIFQQVPSAGYQQQASLFGGMDTTTVILVAGGAVLLLGLAFIVTR